MYELNFLAVTLAITGIVTTSCIAQGINNFPRENANEFLDTGLKILGRKYRSPMTPIPMKQRSFGLNERIGLMNIEAIIRLEDGYITKIGKISRQGDAWMTVIPAANEDEDESTVTEAQIGINDIEFNTTIVFDILGVVHKETIEGSVQFVGAHIFITTNGTTGERDIPYFKIYDIRGANVEFVGPIEAIDRIRNIPVKIATQFIMNTRLKHIVQSIVSNAAYGSIKGIATSSKQ
jgi:hypothetical protein